MARHASLPIRYQFDAFLVLASHSMAGRHCGPGVSPMAMTLGIRFAALIYRRVKIRNVSGDDLAQRHPDRADMRAHDEVCVFRRDNIGRRPRHVVDIAAGIMERDFDLAARMPPRRLISETPSSVLLMEAGPGFPTGPTVRQNWQCAISCGRGALETGRAPAARSALPGCRKFPSAAIPAASTAHRNLQIAAARAIRSPFNSRPAPIRLPSAR